MATIRKSAGAFRTFASGGDAIFSGGARCSLGFNVTAGDGSPAAGDTDYLAADLVKRLAAGPLRWHLVMSFAADGDAVDDAAVAWPDSRRSVDAGTLVIDSWQAQADGPCRDVNYDPTILPQGIEASGDPLLAARSAAYAESYLRRTREEGHLPGAARPKETRP